MPKDLRILKRSQKALADLRTEQVSRKCFDRQYTSLSMMWSGDIWGSWQMPAWFCSSISNLGAMVGRDDYEASMLAMCEFLFALHCAICPKQLMKGLLLYSSVKVFIQILQCKQGERSWSSQWRHVPPRDRHVQWICHALRGVDDVEYVEGNVLHNRTVECFPMLKLIDRWTIWKHFGYLWGCLHLRAATMLFHFVSHFCGGILRPRWCTTNGYLPVRWGKTHRCCNRSWSLPRLSKSGCP